MRLDGDYEPNMVIVRLPHSTVDKLIEGYREEGEDLNIAIENARHRIRTTIMKYLGAGTPFIVIDGSSNIYDGITFMDVAPDEGRRASLGLP